MPQRHGKEFWDAHIDGWKRSGLTQLAYSSEHGIHPKTLSRWNTKKERQAAPCTNALTLVPAQKIVDRQASGLRLTSPGGWHIDWAMPDLPSLVTVLRQLP
jgi:hypothetical protein